jgi:hypothetical protein
MLPGQTVEDYGAVAERLAQTFGDQRLSGLSQM